MRVLPKSLVGRNALFVTLILILNELLWFGVVRPLVFNRFVEAEQVYHPKGLLRLYVELEWAAFALVICTVGVYVIFYWLRRQLTSVVGAARDLADGRTPPTLAETGPEEIRELSRGINQLAARLAALEADRRLMLAGISHDLSTPLTRLRLAVELLILKQDPGQANGMAQDIDEMHSIVRQFLDYVRSGKEEEPVPGDLNLVILDVCRRYSATGRDIRISGAPVPLFSFRPLALRRVLTNLVDNAVRYSTQPLEVSTAVVNGEARVTVLDRGPGIASTDPSSMSAPFVREDVSRGPSAGAGLGLAIVERIAKAHGGRLSITNREGGGLSVTVALPVS